MIRIVIADDHTIMREGLKRILDGADDIEVVGEAVDGFEALAHVRKGGFDLLMLDLSMPGRSGVELIRQIKDEVPKLPILILTMHEEEQYAVRAIRAGARGYRALAITDECSLAGVVRAHVEAKRVGLPLIIGSEFRLSCGMKLVLLATDCASYGQLSTLITCARRNADKDKLLYIHLLLERAGFYCEPF
jgi:CheY-like chemotaxis protein